MNIVAIIAVLFQTIAFYSLAFKYPSPKIHLLTFLLFFNPLFFYSSLSFEGIIMSALIIRITRKFPSKINHLLDLILCLRPPFICVILIREERMGFWVKLLLGVAMIKVDLGEIVFGESFSSGTNLMWLLYIHMFKEYTILYQILMVSIPFLSLYPLRYLKIPPQLKQAISFFFCAFVINTNSHAFLLGFVVVYILAYPILSEQKISNGYQIWPLLTLIIMIVDIMFYSFYAILMDVWQHTHMTNMGYILVTQVVFWIGNGVYLSEGIQLYMSENEKRQRQSIKQYVIQRIKGI